MGEADWAFKVQFEVTEDELRSPHVDLIFDGLDTYATVILVGTLSQTIFLTKSYLERLGDFEVTFIVIKQNILRSATNLSEPTISFFHIESVLGKP